MAVAVGVSLVAAAADVASNVALVEVGVVAFDVALAERSEAQADVTSYVTWKEANAAAAVPTLAAAVSNAEASEARYAWASIVAVVA